ncbi:Hsp20/alpha crystallin family protein [Phytomonospora sp. NPDC050363]|uniref:Hsp20/alpha crystallin family protein n=1 Tax=Phytomonospora sp. NPDC050363 TaxID=3155642 RepID=UPI0033EC6CBB
MVLRYWEPTARLDRADTEFDRIVTRFFGTAPRAADGIAPAADVIADGNDVVISVELPGLSPADIDIEVAPRRLTISGERNATEVAEGQRVLARGRRHGRFRTDFRLPAGVAADNVKANYEHGVLTVRVHEVTKPAPEPVKIAVEGGESASVKAVDAE